jgi:hypothetical protein
MTAAQATAATRRNAPGRVLTNRALAASLGRVKSNGNGRLRALAAETDARFGRMEVRLARVEKDVSNLRKDVRGLRRTTKLFFDLAVDLDTEFRAHRKDWTIHTLQVR